MDEVSKHRLTGAIIWLMLLVFLVPVWFGEPVNFKPEGYVQPEKTAERPLVGQAYVLPEKVQRLEAPTVPKKMEVLAEPAASTAQNTTQNQSKTQWIVRIIAYKDIKDANDLLGRLDGEYDVTIKVFEKSGMYSVRTGPYFSKAKAEKDKQKLDRMLHTQSEVVQLK